MSIVFVTSNRTAFISGSILVFLTYYFAAPRRALSRALRLFVLIHGDTVILSMCVLTDVTETQ